MDLVLLLIMIGSAFVGGFATARIIQLSKNIKALKSLDVMNEHIEFSRGFLKFSDLTK